EKLLELELPWFDVRFDVLDEMKVGLLRFRIIGMASHGDVTCRGFLVESGAQFAPIEQPILKFANAPVRGAVFQLVEQRLDLVPISQTGVFRKKSPGLMRRQLCER